jgi:hypothetical protein
MERQKLSMPLCNESDAKATIRKLEKQVATKEKLLKRKKVVQKAQEKWSEKDKKEKVEMASKLSEDDQKLFARRQGPGRPRIEEKHPGLPFLFD